MPKAVLTIGVGFLLLTMVQAAYGQEDKQMQETIAGNLSGQELVPAYNYLPIAQKFGMDYIAFANMGDAKNEMSIEYLSQGETAENWSRLFTVGLGLTSKEDAAANQEVTKAVANMEDYLRMIEADIHMFDKEETAFGPAARFHYTKGDEETAGVIMRGAPGFIKIMQIAAKKEKLTDADHEEIKKLYDRVYETQTK